MFDRPFKLSELKARLRSRSFLRNINKTAIMIYLATFRCKPLATLVKLGLTLVLLITITGCATRPSIDANDSLISAILNYEASLPENHPDSPEQIFQLPDELKAKISDRFKSSNKHKNASDLARWLMDPNGHNLIYDLDANLMPHEAFEQRRGNCLSFTLLMVELASELDIELRVNQVDVPDMWGQDSQNDLVFYRHVNAIFESLRSTQVFDLAMEEYRPGFPQRLISKREATALMFSNIGIEELKKGNATSAIHYLRLAASTFPANPDMWINLGAIYKHIGELGIAEKIYLQAFSISDKDSLAASNLERLYRRQGRDVLAKQYQKLAARARARNPYLHYQDAEEAYKEKNYRRAANLVKRAIKLHKEDPDFYELSSRIKQANNRYISALKDLEIGYQLTQKNEDRGRYEDKIRMVIAHVEAVEKKSKRPPQSAPNRQIIIYPDN